jgi:nucleoside-diphosphate-sugar epimerase
VTSPLPTRVLVAGATGVIGRSLVQQLRAAGHDVIGTTRSEQRAAALRATGIEAIACDALDAAALMAAVAAAAPEVVIHELTSIPASLETRNYRTQLAPTNALRRHGTRNLVAAAAAAGARRLIAQSVAFAYSPTGDRIKDEQAPLALDSPAPIDEVVAAVAELERQVLDAGGLVLRYGLLYGPGTQFAPDGFYAAAARRRMFPIVGSGAGVWSFVHVDDAAAATAAAVTRGEPGIYNVVDDEPVAVRDWIPVFAASVGAPRPLRVPRLIGRLAGGPAAVAAMTTQRGASNAKAKRELGWMPAHPSWRDGLAAGDG